MIAAKTSRRPSKDKTTRGILRALRHARASAVDTARRQGGVIVYSAKGRIVQQKPRLGRSGGESLHRRGAERSPRPALLFSFHRSSSIFYLGRPMNIEE